MHVFYSGLMISAASRMVPALSAYVTCRTKLNTELCLHFTPTIIMSWSFGLVEIRNNNLEVENEQEMASRVKHTDSSLKGGGGGKWEVRAANTVL